MIGGSKSRKINPLINLINEQNDIDKIYLYAKNLSEHEILIKRCKNAGVKYFNDRNTFIECSNAMDDVYGNFNDYNPSRKRKILIVFDSMIVDIMTNKKFHAKIELFERCRKLNISLVFITQSCFAFLEDVRLNFVEDEIFIHYKMINLDNIANENNKEHNKRWPYIPDHPYKILIIGGSGSGKTNALLNLIN